MTNNRNFSFSGGFTSYDSPGQGIAKLGQFDNMASPIVTPQAGVTNGYSSTDAVVADAWHRYEATKRTDDAKNQLVEELIHRYNYVSQEYTKLLEQVDREKAQSRFFSVSTPSYKDDYDNLKQCVDRDPFVLVLIDGDGMIFHEHFLNRGEEGGRNAAQVLRSSTELYAREQMPDLPPAFKVVTRMYANVKGLADTCCRAGLVDSPALLEDFVRGFTRGDTLFDFVDVGPGRDRADEKVSEIFKLHAYDVRCKHIVFGCSHDNGFARLLEKYIFDETITSRVTLLEGLPFGKELLELPFTRSKFGTIFRSDKIVLTPIQTVVANRDAAAALLRSMTHTPSESVSSLGDASYAKPSAMSTWANRAAAVAAAPPPTPPSEKATPASLTKNTIPRNRKGQRIDPLMKHDKGEVERVRKMKMCNVHYLRDECPYGNKCTHKHDRTPAKKDLEILKVVARFSCCRTGSSCDDPKCIYGHRCQAPERLDLTKWPTEKGKTCIFGPECVFPAELHNIDTIPVKTTKV